MWVPSILAQCFPINPARLFCPDDDRQPSSTTRLLWGTHPTRGLWRSFLPVFDYLLQLPLSRIRAFSKISKTTKMIKQEPQSRWIPICATVDAGATLKAARDVPGTTPSPQLPEQTQTASKKEGKAGKSGKKSAKGSSSESDGQKSEKKMTKSASCSPIFHEFPRLTRDRFPRAGLDTRGGCNPHRDARRVDQVSSLVYGSSGWETGAQDAVRGAVSRQSQSTRAVQKIAN